MTGFEGKVAIVTGSATGVGAATAILLAQKGCNVVVNYTRSKDEADMAIVSMWNALQLGLNQAKDKVAHLSANQLLAALGVDTAKQTWDDLAEKAQQLIS